MNLHLFLITAIACVTLAPADDSVLSLRFDEGSGTIIADTSGNGLNGKASGASWTRGISGTALQCNGKSVVTIPNAQALSTPHITVMFWIRIARSESDKQIFAKKSSGKEGYRITCTANTLTWQIPSAEKPWGYALKSSALSMNEWHHAACTYDGASMNIYIDGAPAGTLPRTGDILPSRADLSIGAFDASGTSGFSGTIDEVGIYARALSADEVRDDLSAGKSLLDASSAAAREHIPHVTPNAVITVRTRSGDERISPFLTGSQFDFFATPVRARMKSASLLDTWKSVPIRMLRYPGGTWADHYIWDNPAKSYFATGETNVITPEQFIAICRAVNAEPIFQVNTGSKGGSIDNRVNPTKRSDIHAAAAWAAAWVRVANIEKKWNVKYWEIGNEVWIWLKPEEYAVTVAEYSKAMKAVDPSIEIIACGCNSTVGPFNATWLNFKDDPNWTPRTNVVNEPVSWNKALFTIAKGSFDLLAPHPYISAPSNTDAASMYRATLAKIARQEGMQSQYDAVNTYDRSVRIAVTEWGCNFGYSVPGSSGKIRPEQGFFYSLGNGITMAYYLGKIIENTMNEIAIVHSLGDIQTLWYWTKKELAKDAPLEHPAMLALRLWGNHLGTKRSLHRTDIMPALNIDGEPIPAIYLFASEDETNRYCIAINLDPENANRVRFRSDGANAAVSLLIGASLAAQNFDGWGAEEKPVRIVAYTLPSSDGMFSVDMPKHSMAGITVRK
ncbi:MAG: LamG-like jellyroll fold domain-containing protein [Spirochaetota bacterium]